MVECGAKLGELGGARPILWKRDVQVLHEARLRLNTALAHEPGPDVGRVSLTVLGQVIEVGVTHSSILGGAGVIFDIWVKGFDTVGWGGIHEVLRNDNA